MAQDHYLKRELYELLKSGPTVFDFLQLGSLDGIWYWDLDNREHEWMSPRFWEVLGYDPAQRRHLVTEWQDLIFPEDLPTVVENFEKHCADPDHPYDQVVRYRHRDGSTVWVRCRGIAIRDDQGRPIRLLGAHTDLTLFKRTEERLLQKTRELKVVNERLRGAIERIGVLESSRPVCRHCKRIRDERDEWVDLDGYLETHTSSRVTRGVCPDCADRDESAKS